MVIDLGHFELWSLIVPISIAIVGIGIIWKLGDKSCDFLFNKYIRKLDQDYVTVPEFSATIKKVYLDCQTNRDHCKVVESFSEHLNELKNTVRGTAVAIEMLVLRSTVLKDDDKERALRALRGGE